MRLTVVQRRLLSRTFLLGAALTLGVMIVEYSGRLAPFERYLYDRRARDCQFVSPSPSKSIVVVQLDDQTITEVGRWPWPRDKQAIIIDELRLAGAKVIALDIMLTEEEQARYRRGDDGAAIEINNDAILAEAFAKAGNVLAPSAAGGWAKEIPDISQRVMEAVVKDPEIETEEILKALATNATDRKRLEQLLKQDFGMLQEQAILQRMDQLLVTEELELDSAVEKVTPRAVATGTISDARQLAKRSYYRVKAMRKLDRFLLPVPPNAPPLMRARVQDLLVTIPILIENAAFSGFVDFPTSADGVVRAVPLVANFRGKLYPHMILATACAYLGVPVSSIQLTEDTLTLPVPNQQPIKIPINLIQDTEYGTVGAFMSIPWFGTKYWENMYDWPNYKQPVQQDSIKNIWRVQVLQQQVERNRRDSVEAMQGLRVRILGEDEKATAKLLEEMDSAQLDEAIAKTISDKDFIGPAYEAIKSRPAGEWNADEAFMVGTYEALKQIPVVNDFLRQRVTESRADLKLKYQDKIVIVGATSLGLYDFYPTSLHPQCPGVVIQSAALNGILVRNFWKTAPSWLNLPITALMGAITTLFVAFLPSYRALLATVLLTLSYFVFNGIVLFDYGDWLVPAAGAISAAGLVWGILTLYRYIFESAERTRITKRFSGYVDPALVNYLVENPEAKLDGEVKEMTVVFTDLAGFTTISEKLKERTVPLLNEYMSRMLPIIRANRGFWNKFLGDGIMFFYNSIPPNPDHARDAVYTVLDMQKEMEEFNKYLFEQKLPKVAMRAGISTGNMVVGDAGSNRVGQEAADYTVLGDEVNLAARLESANKTLGSRTLITHRTVELMGPEFLTRPIGRLQVVGKTQGVLTHEPMCLLAEATEAQKNLALLTKEIVDCFIARNFHAVIAAADRMQDEFGSSKLTALYLGQAREYLIAPPPDDWDGTIVLESK